MSNGYQLKIGETFEQACKPRQLDNLASKVYDEFKPGALLVQIDGRPAASAFIEAASNRAVTNHHVASFGKEIELKSESGDIYRARVEKWDELHDLAVLEVEGLEPGAVKTFKLSATSTSLKSGDPLFVMGHPRAVEEPFISPGHFDKQESLFDFLCAHGQTPESYKNLRSTGYIREELERPLLVDQAHSEHGNSGSPAVDKQGVVQGVLFAVSHSTPGIAFLTPVDDLHNLLAKPAQDKFQYRYAANPWVESYKNSWSESPVSALGSTGAAGAIAALAYLGAKRFPLVTLGIAGSVALGTFGVDGHELSRRHSMRDELKYGLATSCDLISLGGAALGAFTSRPELGIALTGLGVLGRLSCDFIPNHLLLDSAAK